jgi:hypothetical protein
MGTSITDELLEMTKNPSLLVTLVLYSAKYPAASEMELYSSVSSFLRVANQVLGKEGSVQMADLLSVPIQGHFGIHAMADGKGPTHSIAFFAHLYVDWMAITLSIVLILSNGRNHFVEPAAETEGVVEPMRIIYQATLFEALKEGGYSELVDAVLEHFSLNLGLSRGGDHLYRSFSMGDEQTVLDMLAFSAGQLTLDHNLKPTFLAASAQVMAEASTRPEFSASAYLASNIYNVSSKKHKTDKRSHNAVKGIDRDKFKAALGNLKL